MPQILPHEQGFDLGCRAGAGHLAVGHGEHLGEVERRAREVPRQALGFEHVIPGIGDEPLRVFPPHAGDVSAFDVRALRRCQAKVACRRFERVVWQVALKHIEGQHLQVGIDDVSTGDVQSGEIHRALGKPHTGRKGARY